MPHLIERLEATRRVLLTDEEHMSPATVHSSVPPDINVCVCAVAVN